MGLQYRLQIVKSSDPGATCWPRHILYGSAVSHGLKHNLFMALIPIIVSHFSQILPSVHCVTDQASSLKWPKKFPFARVGSCVLPNKFTFYFSTVYEKMKKLSFFCCKMVKDINLKLAFKTKITNYHLLSGNRFLIDIFLYTFQIDLQRNLR